MDCNSPVPDADTLRQLSYSELRKFATKQGIKKRGSMKADKIIAKLLSSMSSDEMDGFSTPMAKELNSSRKNKEKQFNVDALTPLPTPRRGTYSVETPIACVLSENMEADSSLSPVIVPLTSPVLDISNVTMLRGSERKLRPRKVSFVSPKKFTPRTPTKYISLKDRPKTPVASKSGSRRPLLTTLIGQKADSLKRLINNSDCDAKENMASKMKRTATPNFRLIHQKAIDKMESIDDYQQRKLKQSAEKIAMAGKSKNKTTKPKTKIPVPFSGIPFIPSMTSCAGLKFDFSSGIPKSFVDEKKTMLPPQKNLRSSKTGGMQKAEMENDVPKRSGKKPKFDLQASLSRKLGYKPYTGPLKPLCDSNCLNSPIPVCHHGVLKEPSNPVVHVTRESSRTVLKGVRTNKRFELQMKNRKLE